MIWLDNIKLFSGLNEFYREIVSVLVDVVSQDVGGNSKFFSQPIVKEEEKVPIRNSFDKRPLYIPETPMGTSTESSLELVNNFCIHEGIDLRFSGETR